MSKKNSLMVSDSIFDCLVEAQRLLDDLPEIGNKQGEYINNSAPEDLMLSSNWLEKCVSLCESGVLPSREPIRTIHHLSCTGGSLLSKCLSAMPNTILLSELNPASSMGINLDKPSFSPTDVIRLSHYAQVPNVEELSKDIFLSDINILSNHLYKTGKQLVIRDHTHSDFLYNEVANNSFIDILRNKFDTLSLVTVRHPIDSYLSLIKNGWAHFEPKDLSEYCRRYLLFLDGYQGVTIIKYEDFIANPLGVMENICETLMLPYNEDFLDFFDISLVTGDSGRSSSTIASRPRREYSDDLVNHSLKCREYLNLCERLDYDPCLTE